MHLDTLKPLFSLAKGYLTCCRCVVRQRGTIINDKIVSEDIQPRETDSGRVTLSKPLPHFPSAASIALFTI